MKETGQMRSTLRGCGNHLTNILLQPLVLIDGLLSVHGLLPFGLIKTKPVVKLLKVFRI